MTNIDKRAQKRIENRLAKKGISFLRWEQNDPQLITIRAIVETKCPQRFARACVYPRNWLRHAGPRVIADSILCEFQRNHGRTL